MRPKQFLYQVLVEVAEARTEVHTVAADSEAEAIKLAGQGRRRHAAVEKVRRRRATPLRVLLADPNPDRRRASAGRPAPRSAWVLLHEDPYAGPAVSAHDCFESALRAARALRPDYSYRPEVPGLVFFAYGPEAEPSRIMLFETEVSS